MIGQLLSKRKYCNAFLIGVTIGTFMLAATVYSSTVEPVNPDSGKSRHLLKTDIKLWS